MANAFFFSLTLRTVCGQYKVIRLRMSLIHKEVSFIRKESGLCKCNLVEFQSLPPFPMSHLSQWVGPNLQNLYSFDALSYNVFNRFISFADKSSLALLLHFIDFRFDIISLYRFVCTAIRKDFISLLRFPSPGYVPVFSVSISPFCRLKYPYSYFFPFSAPEILSSIYIVNVIISCFHVFFCFLNIIFDSAYRCMYTIFNVGNSLYSYFSWLQSSFLVHLNNGPQYLSRKTAQVFILLMRFLRQGLVSRIFSFFFFFSSPLGCWCPIAIFSNTYNFASLQMFEGFPDLIALFFRCFSFLTYHYEY